MLYCAFLHEKAKKYTLHLIRFLCQIAFFTIPGQKDSHAWREFGKDESDLIAGRICVVDRVEWEKDSRIITYTS